MQALASVRDFMWMKYISWNCIVARGLLGIVYIVHCTSANEFWLDLSIFLTSAEEFHSLRLSNGSVLATIETYQPVYCEHKREKKNVFTFH